MHRKMNGTDSRHGLSEGAQTRGSLYVVVAFFFLLMSLYLVTQFSFALYKYGPLHGWVFKLSTKFFSTHLRDWKTPNWTRSSSSTCSPLCPPINVCTWLISSAVFLFHAAVNESYRSHPWLWSCAPNINVSTGSASQDVSTRSDRYGP